MDDNEMKKQWDIINKYKNNTAYFDKSVSEDEMYEMLYNRMRFGVAETEVILAALKLAGAKFN